MYTSEYTYYTIYMRIAYVSHYFSHRFDFNPCSIYLENVE